MSIPDIRCQNRVLLNCANKKLPQKFPTSELPQSDLHCSVTSYKCFSVKLSHRLYTLVPQELNKLCPALQPSPHLVYIWPSRRRLLAHRPMTVAHRREEEFGRDRDGGWRSGGATAANPIHPTHGAGTMQAALAARGDSRTYLRVIVRLRKPRLQHVLGLTPGLRSNPRN